MMRRVSMTQVPHAALPVWMWASLVLMSCTTGAGQEAVGTGGLQRLEGRVEPWVSPERRTQATLVEIATGATVSLIDSTTGNSVASTVTRPDGTFTLTIPGFNPITGQPYYLEAVKGLSAGGNPNRAGSAIARVRTLVLRNGSWTSLTGSYVNISRATTATSVLVAYRGLSVSQQAALMGKVSDQNLDVAGTALQGDDYMRVFDLVTEAIAADQDPVWAINHASGGTNAADRFARRTVLFTLMDSFSPAIASPGGTVTFQGQGLPTAASEDIRVSISGTPVATWSVTSGQTRLTVTLAPETPCGYLEVLQGPNRVVGPFVPVSGTTGTLAGAGGVAGYQDGRGFHARLYEPTDVVLDGAGNLFVADSRNNRIRKINPAGDVMTLAGSGAAAFADGAGSAAAFNFPTALDLAPAGHFVVSDPGNSRIRVVTAAGVVSTLAGSGTRGSVDGPGAAAQFNNVAGLAVDASGRTTCAGDDVKLRVVSASGVVTTLAGGTSGHADGTGTAARFTYLYGLAFDTSGNLWATDRDNRTLRRITPAGVVTTVTPSLTLNYPGGLAIEGTGQLVVADTLNYRIVRVQPSNGAATVLAGSGSQGWLDGPNARARFNQHAGWNCGLHVGPNGLIYVADRYNHAIRVIAP